MKLGLRGCLILVSVFFVGCTKGTPAFQTISEDNIPLPYFNEEKTQTFKAYATGKVSKPFLVNGFCDPKISDIKATFENSSIGSQKLRELSANDAVTSVDIKCTTEGTFTFTLAELSKLGFTIVDGSEYKVLLQSVTSSGMSKPSTIAITYDTRIGGTPPFVVNSGGATQLLGQDNYSLQHVRVGSKSAVPTASVSGAHRSFELNDTTTNGYKAYIGVRLNSPVE